MDADSAQPGTALRPQSLMLTFLGNYVLGRDVCVYSGSVIDVFARTGVGEPATRSTLARMVNRGLLSRQREGRKMYFGLTARSAAILRDGEERIWKAGAVNRDWDGTWTLLGFSLPESWQRQRHDLRSQLTWAGFGPLWGGVWIAPGRAEVAGIVAGLGLEAHVKVFRSTAEPGTDIGRMIEETWDLPALAARYADFLARWRPFTEAKQHPEVSDPLSTKLLLFTEWLQIVRADPRLPAQHLPAQWPAAAAEDLFRAANALVDEPARRMAEELLDTVPDVTAPDVTAPDVTAPDVTEPDTAVPNVHSSS
ncbi:PaaX family transcriptional regulator C-terminal domain-containing protein [Actinocrinis sp.]|uniref:PaaX family transcriptional regulator n=1 Tax=Actinocrinis sp. TaxID=1920516 RepID=UPI002D3386EA|nr:PaaX family transcriptional regulator C-terminal domain-containing protein [Actinocrinis sp.]HZP53752.1 PaaX family transcriptional regulator C-terminal domain-containing protein [Actinocrinis sp.]